MMNTNLPGVSLKGDSNTKKDPILTDEALQFLTSLHRTFEEKRQTILLERKIRQDAISRGSKPHFLAETASIREKDWQVSPPPHDLEDRRVEITGPADTKMIINALNSGASAFMADFEDSLSPTWNNLLEGQEALKRAVRRDLEFKSPEGKTYSLGKKLATLIVRPRGWHLSEKHLLIDGKPISASLFDFGLYLFHNAQELIRRGSGPYFYLPKLEHHQEARLWNDVFKYSEKTLNLTHGTIKCTVLIETVLAAFEMDEILYELKDHIVGLNAGRWDYIFSMIKKFRNDPNFILPDRSAITMSVPFMRAYSELLVKTCHLRGAHAIGGMSAFIPSRKNEEVNRVAYAKVKEDKAREAQIGFDGTWVAHPDLVQVAVSEFQAVLKDRPHQKTRQRSELLIKEKDLLNLDFPNAGVTEAGIINNINVAIQYLHFWLKGSGAVALHNLMEDVATAEISRAQLWQWVHHQATVVGGRKMTAALYIELRNRELDRLGKETFSKAADLLDQLILHENFAEFLTLDAYEELCKAHS